MHTFWLTMWQARFTTTTHCDKYQKILESYTWTFFSGDGAKFSADKQFIVGKLKENGDPIL